MIDKEFKRHGINLSEEEYPDFLQKLMIKKQYNSMDDFYAAVGYGGIQLWKIMPRLKEEYQKAYASDIEEIDVPQAPVNRPKASAGVVIEGADDVLVKFQSAVILCRVTILSAILQGATVFQFTKGIAQMCRKISVKVKNPKDG